MSYRLGCSMEQSSIIQTRSATDIWLIGPVSELLVGKKLPTSRQVLSVFFHQHKVLKKTVRDSARFAVRLVLEFWNKARIPTTIERNVIDKLEKLFDSWGKLKKNSKRETVVQKTNETVFQAEIDKLFDIAHADALTLIKIPEDRLFLNDQRADRKGYMAGVDNVLAKKEERSKKRQISQQELQRQEDERKKQCHSVSSASLYVSDAEMSTDELDEEFSPPSSVKIEKRPANIISPQLASALDRTNVSDRDATYLLAATAQSLGHDIGNFNISRASIRRVRIANRTMAVQRLKEQFISHESHQLTVHWDGKLLPDITGHATVDRLPVLVSGHGIEQLLGVPKLNHGTGEETSNAVIHQLKEWVMIDRVKAMCFDTTASNTGCHAGACSLIEKKLDKDLLFLACRHLVHEIILADVFKHAVGASSGPEIGLFKRF